MLYNPVITPEILLQIRRGELEEAWEAGFFDLDSYCPVTAKYEDGLSTADQIEDDLHELSTLYVEDGWMPVSRIEKRLLRRYRGADNDERPQVHAVRKHVCPVTCRSLHCRTTCASDCVRSITVQMLIQSDTGAERLL